MESDKHVVYTIKIIYPCNHCVSCNLDLNNQEPYVCTYSGHHSWSPEGLAGDCQNKEMINWAINMNIANINNGEEIYD